MCHHHEFGCGHGAFHAHSGGAHHHWRCCCGVHGFTPRWPSREEVIAQMEQYLKDLEAEARAVEDRIAEMKDAG